MTELTLRHYQIEAIRLVRESIKEKNKRIVILLATGGGKSLVAQSIIESAVAKGNRVMFLVNRVQLVDQMSAHLTKSGIIHGILQGANTRGAYNKVVIASIDTIHARGYPDVSLILADECHSAASSEKYQKLFEHYKDIPIIGVTATASMVKGLGKEYPWGRLFEDIVCPISIPELIEQGYLVDVDIYAPSEPDLSGVRIVAGDYHEKQLSEAVDKPKLIGDIIDQWMKRAKGKQTIVFAVDISHSKKIVKQFVDAGVTAEHIDYRMTYEEKKEIVRRFKACEFTVLSNCALLSEGFDAPATETMILARPTRSLKSFIQMTGRILRPHPSKTGNALLLDHSGSTKILGFPTDEQPVTLDNGKPKKSESVGDKKKKEDKLPTPCIKCTYLKTSNIHKCPICGFAPERQSTVETIDGTLEKLERKEKKFATIDKKKLYQELRYIANEKKWSSGRLSNVFRDIAGVFPNFYKEEPAIEASPETRRMVQHLNIKFAKSQQKIRQE